MGAIRPITVEAKYPAESQGELKNMVKALLVDRFRARVHNETREGPVYLRVVARNDGRLGPGLQPAEIPCGDRTRENTKDKQQKSILDGLGCMELSSDRFVRGAERPLSALAMTLGQIVGAPVVDRTGLVGKFDYSVEWLPEPPSPGSAPAPPASAVFTAVQEQLGLKLQPSTGPIDVTVIDSVEQPQDN